MGGFAVAVGWITRSGCVSVGLYSVVDRPGVHGSGLVPGLHSQTVALGDATPNVASSANVSAHASAPTISRVDLLRASSITRTPSVAAALARPQRLNLPAPEWRDKRGCGRSRWRRGAGIPQAAAVCWLGGRNLKRRCGWADEGVCGY